ncbi:hypothetical protein [Bacillus sp. AFS075034]|uniref:hypothetical protein n=1 Tax=Bacillus sp. AFS075034 TaxID=2034281 RepID=UPI000BF523AC|nr:hypothetical protein [Bacillus sp. AFS075034]PFW61544.1 hypothetical protein COL20_17025 [Bacillus sp. AFS075034]
MKTLVSVEEAVSLFSELNNVSDLEAALLRASIFVCSKVKDLSEQVPDDVKLAVCYLVKDENEPTKLKSIERSTYKETFDDKAKTFRDIAMDLLEEYMKPKSDSGVFFF